MDIIRVPFGYVLDWLCQFAGNYGIALILFSVLIKVVLLPLSMKSKKSMLKMSRLAPQLKILETQCGDDKEKYQQEASKLYKEEGVSMFGGCLWSLLPLILLFPVYYVIPEPITYLLHFTADEARQIVEIIAKNVTLDANQAYQQLQAVPYLMTYADQIKAAVPAAAEKLHEINFMFCGVDLAVVPEWKFWTFTSINQLWLFLVPIFSAGTQLLSSIITQNLNNQVATNENGEKDAATAAAANKNGKTMMYLMPIMSLYFCFVMPCAMSLYWIAQAVFSTVQEIVLTNHYRKIYDAEDAEKRELAAAERAKEAERERLRQERREKYGEEGLFDKNTSKKKRKQQAAEEAKAAATAYLAAKEQKENPQSEEEISSDTTAEDKHFSGDTERPHCRGRNYKASRYGRKEDTTAEKSGE